MRRLLISLAATLFLAPSAHAVDGVLEINQACVSVGCFSGDGNDFPVEITSPGGYRLTSNLLVPDAATRGIWIKAPSVDIDLNGFSIVRAACEDVVEGSCVPPAGTGTGIYGTEEDTSTSSVRNGTITGMGMHGISLARGARISGVTLKWNRGNGIYVHEGSSIITGCTAYQNGAIGISARHAGISNSSSYENGSEGFYVRNSTLLGSAASGNGGIGIHAESSLVSGNTASGNGDDGIFAENSTVSNNNSYNNTGYGLGLDSYSGYRGNTIRDNTKVGVDGGVDAGGNVCDGETACGGFTVLSK